MKRVISCIFFIGSFFVVERLCHHATDGFAINKVRYPLSDELVDSDSMSLEGKIALDNLTNQTFNYLDSGAQVYAFLSEDERYVLKLFKFQHMRIPQWVKYLPLPEPLRSYRAQKLKRKRQLIQGLFDSFTLAKNRLSEETGLIFLHLRKNQQFDQMITICDKAGVVYQIDPNTTYFVLQKRADLAYKKINEWMACGKVEAAREGICSLLQLAHVRCKKGIFDKDPDFSTNFGFCEGKAIQLDIGRFSICPARNDPPHVEMVRITRAFRAWLKKNHSILVEVLDEELERITSENLD